MDKKNTMLLTVIAVATLLVAVVGATFAFFSLSTSGSSNTSATVTTGKVGAITFDTTTPNLVLDVSAQDMIKGEGDKTYYAVAGTYSEGEFKNGTSNSPIALGTATLSGAAEGDTYTCNATVTVTAGGSMLSLLEKGWVSLALTGDLVSGGEGLDSIDLADLKASNTKTVTVNNLSFTDTTPKTVSGLLSLVNKHDAEQNAIADKTLTVSVKVAPVADSCKVTSAGD